MKEIGKRTHYYLRNGVIELIGLVVLLIVCEITVLKETKSFQDCIPFLILFCPFLAIATVVVCIEYSRMNYKVYIKDGKLIYKDINISLDDIIKVDWSPSQSGKFVPLDFGHLLIETKNGSYKIKSIAEIKIVCLKLEEELALNKRKNYEYN